MQAAAAGGTDILEPVDLAAVGEGERHDLPVPEGQLAATVARADLRGAPDGRGPVIVSLDAGARVDVLAKSEDGQRVRARTYGALSFEGWLPAAAVSADAPAAAAATPVSKGLNPTHEALLDAPAFADAASKVPIGILHGGALMTVGIEAGANDTVKVMTHGDAVAELWVPRANLRPLDPSIWAEGP